MYSKFRKVIPFNKQQKKFKKNPFITISERFSYLCFKYSKVRENSVLVLEANYDSHSEIIPYFVQYFKDKGFNTDVIISPWLNHLKCLDKLKGFKKYVFDVIKYKRFINEPKIKDYKYIFFTSEIIYNVDGMFSIFQMFPDIKKYEQKIYKVQHHLDMGIDENTISLFNAENLDDKVAVANAHYFGDIEITNNNSDKTEFIFVGALEKCRRDTDLLLDAVHQLSENGITNFHITHIGRESIDIPNDIKKYFTFLGYTDFTTLIKAMEEADFYLPLLNPEIESHSRYAKDGTSGAFQLIYGFIKPCIIHNTYAKIYNLEKCSIVYNNNVDFANSMKEAINMQKQEYSNLQEELKVIVKSIEKESEQNLDRIFMKDTI